MGRTFRRSQDGKLSLDVSAPLATVLLVILTRGPFREHSCSGVLSVARRADVNNVLGFTGTLFAPNVLYG